MSSTDDSLLPRVPIGDWVDGAFDWIDDNLSIVLQLFRDVMTAVVEGLIDALMWPPALVMVAVFALVAWLVASWRLAVGTALGFALIISMDIWLPAMQTLAHFTDGDADSVVEPKVIGMTGHMEHRTDDLPPSRRVSAASIPAGSRCRWSAAFCSVW